MVYNAYVGWAERQMGYEAKTMLASRVSAPEVSLKVKTHFVYLIVFDADVYHRVIMFCYTELHIRANCLPFLRHSFSILYGMLKTESSQQAFSSFA
uniref:Uncharacterized protein n=1 Tax=Oryza brachyantha TaxID=4533 RepID=J3LGP5_ORYBR